MLANVFIVLSCVGGASLFLVLVSRKANLPARKESNDFTGAVVAVIGTMYAVILAFTLSGVWNVFQQTQANVEQEAADLVDIFRIGGQLPAGERREVQELALQYAQLVLSSEWPAMRASQTPHGGGPIINQLWVVAGRTKADSAAQEQAIGALMSSLSSLTHNRGVRIMQGRESLPPILWAVLIAGGIVTVLASCFFGVQNFRFHLLQVLALSFLISLVLVAIADIDRPFQGEVAVSPEGFAYAVRTFDQERAK